jgi:hypothetical protein
MFRTTFTILSFCSLTALAFVLSGLVRSDGKADRFYVGMPLHQLGSICFMDGLVIFTVVEDWPGHQPFRWQHAPFPPDDGPRMQSDSPLEHPYIEHTWLGVRVGTDYQQFATRDDGSAYISAADGPMPQTLVYGHVNGVLQWYSRPKLWSAFLKEYWIAGRCWIFALLFAALPACWTFRTLRHRWRAVRRKRIGHCFYCGYDLRHSEGRCPECGKPTAENGTVTNGIKLTCFPL